MSASLSADIQAISSLNIGDLRRRWRMLSGKPVPVHVPRVLLIMLITYRMQANAYGDLDRASKRLLDKISKDLRGRAPGANSGAGGEGRAAVPPRPELKPLLPGTYLVREHDGVLHRVMVLEEGFAWNGMVYDSLSQIARAITGTRWNGPRFFGLRESKKKPSRSGANP
jgi:hypothetical protein